MKASKEFRKAATHLRRGVEATVDSTQPYLEDASTKVLEALDAMATLAEQGVSAGKDAVSRATDTIAPTAKELAKRAQQSGNATAVAKERAIGGFWRASHHASHASNNARTWWGAQQSNASKAAAKSGKATGKQLGLAAALAAALATDTKDQASGIGKWLGWAPKKAADSTAQQYARKASAVGSVVADRASDYATQTASSVTDLTGKAVAVASDVARTYGPQAADLASNAADTARYHASKAGDYASQAREAVTGAAAVAKSTATDYASQAAERLAPLADQASKIGAQAVGTVSDVTSTVATKASESSQAIVGTASAAADAAGTAVVEAGRFTGRTASSLFWLIIVATALLFVWEPKKEEQEKIFKAIGDFLGVAERLVESARGGTK